MALTFLSFEQYKNIAIAELRRSMPTIDPTVPNQWGFTFVTSMAALAFSLSLSVKDLLRQLFPQTAGGEFLDLWGQYENIPRPPATESAGDISIEGVDTTLIPIGTVFTGANGLDYTSTLGTTVNVVSQAITTLTRVGTTVTAEMAANHTLATGISVTTSGANEADYNGTFVINVNDRDQFTYEITGTPATPATGTIEYTSTYAVVNVTSDTTGIDTIISGAGELTLKESIDDIDDSGFVQFDGISGGADILDDESYREIILLSRSDITGVFTSDQIKVAVLSVSGNTRVFVKKPTLLGAGGSLDPLPGQVSIFFLRDNDPSILPSPELIATTKQAVIDDGKLPANTAEADVYVQGPALVEQAFVFLAISPDTTTMRSAITANLQAFFEDTVEFEESVPSDSYRAAIQATQDTVTNDILSTFTLTSPTGPIVVTSGEIAIFGGATYP